MSVASLLGVEDTDGPTLALARERWRSWAVRRPELRVVDDLLDLPAWTASTNAEAKNGVLLEVARLGSIHGEGDQLATTVLAWLLLPGAVTMAARMSDLSPRIDELVGTHLWIEARTFDRRVHRCVAGTVLRATRKAVHVELGIGDAARRRDRAWSESVCLPHDSPGWNTPDHSTVGDDPLIELRDVTLAAIERGVIDEGDWRMLVDLSTAADLTRSPIRHGRGGLMAPAPSQMVADRLGVSSRTVRRRARRTLERLNAFAVDEVPVRQRLPTPNALSPLSA